MFPTINASIHSILYLYDVKTRFMIALIRLQVAPVRRRQKKIYFILCRYEKLVNLSHDLFVCLHTMFRCSIPTNWVYQRHIKFTKKNRFVTHSNTMFTESVLIAC